MDPDRRPETVHALLLQGSRAGLDRQQADGSMPGGHNGPYRDPETPVRNTAHWLCSWTSAYELTGDPRFRAAATSALDFLLGPSARPMQAAFFCRSKPDKDFANGLIGQAWVIEALNAAGRVLGRNDAVALAVEVFLLHPFEARQSLWRRVNVDGSWNTIDPTFNHQLWFAAAGALLFEHGGRDVRDRVEAFVNWAERGGLRLHGNGRVRHKIPPKALLRRAGVVAGDLLHPVKALRLRGYMANKEAGYHAFNLYALAMLKQTLPNHRLWQGQAIKRALAYLRSRQFNESLNGNRYAYPYNPTGFEVAFAVQEFDEGGTAPPDIAAWLGRQLDRSWCPTRQALCRDTVDPATLAARLYEITRLRDWAIAALD